MAAEVGQRISGWSHSDSPYSDDLPEADGSVQQMVLDHGSVSFGRFAAESLSWENRSVFAHNRRQEEISKLTMPGLVTKKKAFFEEYYKKKAQQAMHQSEATSEERNDDTTLGHTRQGEELQAVISENPVPSAPRCSFEPSSGASLSDEKKCKDPHGHGLGYLTFNPLFSQLTGLQNIQQEKGSSTDQKQYVDGQFRCATRTNSKHALNHETLERKVLAPKHVVSTDNSESNVAASRIVLPIASLHPKGLKVDTEKQEARKSVPVISRSTKRAKDPSTSLIHTRNSANRNFEDLKDPFHKRVEMKLRALSDRMNADRAASSSKAAPCQHGNRYSYQNADRAATPSSSSLCQNTDRVSASSKLAARASDRSYKQAQCAALPRTTFYNKGSQACHVASSKISTTGKVVATSSMKPNSSQINAKPFRTSQVTLKKAAGPTSVSNAPQNKRKQLSTPAEFDENKRSRGYLRISAPASARSSSDSLHPYKTAKAPKLSNGENVVKKPTYGSHPAGGRNVLPKHTINCNEQNRKVTSSRATSMPSSTKNNLTSGLSRSKSKPRQERLRWR